jgi:hypothetical protein
MRGKWGKNLHISEFLRKMHIFVEIWDDEGKEVTFYTIRKEGAEETETDKFFVRFEKDLRYRAHLQELAAFILDAMGDHLGAREEYFRFENAASALPPSPRAVRNLSFDFEGFPLRLYCMRLSSRLVILMNGGLKTSQAAQDSKDLSMKLIEANKFAKAIEAAFKDGTIWIGIGGRMLESDEEEIVLYY